jgi:hypothetical protein
VTKTLAKLTFGIAALAAATWFGTSSSRAYGDAPWCAVKTLSGDVYWNCQYRTVEECTPNVMGKPEEQNRAAENKTVLNRAERNCSFGWLRPSTVDGWGDALRPAKWGSGSVCRSASGRGGLIRIFGKEELLRCCAGHY